MDLISVDSMGMRRADYVVPVAALLDARTMAKDSHCTRGFFFGSRCFALGGRVCISFCNIGRNRSWIAVSQGFPMFILQCLQIR